MLFINLLREIRRTFARFLSIMIISALGVAFFAGLRASGPDMKTTLDTYFDKQHLADITVFSSAGVTDDDIDALRQIEGVEDVMPVLALDAIGKVKEKDAVDCNIHLTSLPFARAQEYPVQLQLLPSYDIDMTAYRMNQLEVTKGRLPLDDHEVVLDGYLLQERDFELGDWMEFTTSGGSVNLRVVGFVDSSQYISVFERGSSTVGSSNSDGFAFASGNAISKLGTRLPILAALSTRYSQVEITVSGAAELNAFSEEYSALVRKTIKRIEERFGEDEATWYVYDRDHNPGYEDCRRNTERIEAIAGLFPLIFFLVAALVALTTMTRMVEDQRVQMGTFKALGYSKGAVAAEYIAYAAAATVVGGVIGSLIGFRVFPLVIGNVYTILFRLPDFHTPYIPYLACLAIALAVICTVGATVAACIGSLREVPATLMRPKAPKPGKRVFLEKIVFLWNHFNFSTKVTIRNLVRYKKRFFMSVIGIAGSCALLVTSFGLRDAIFGIEEQQFNKIWHMDVQVYAYEPMPLNVVEALATEQDVDKRITDIVYVCDKQMDAALKGADGAENVHFMIANDAGALQRMVTMIDEEGKLIPLTDDGAVVTRKFANEQGVHVGDTLVLTEGTQSHEVRVSGITENYVYHYVYCTGAYYEQVTGKKAQYNGFMAMMNEVTDEAEDALASQLLEDSRIYSILFMTNIYKTIFDSLNTLNYIVLVLLVSAALLAFVVMFNLTNINITERRREMATLRVLGFSDREMYSYVFRENNALAVIGTLVGLVLGVVLHSFVVKTCEVDMVMFVRQIKWLSFIYSAGLTVVFSLLVNLFMRRKVRAIDMIESLKSAE